MAGEPRAGSVLLLHGVRANRLEMLGRARFLHRHGFSVLLFDFQAHGESPGRNITFGHLESADARAALDFLKLKTPGERLGVIGLSLGGAAAIVSQPPLGADAMVLEGVYATFSKAVENRLAMRFGAFSRYLEPMLTWQVRPRLGFDPAALQPVEHIAGLHVPILLIAGEADQHATLEEMQLLHARAHDPKELWIIAGARHVDFHRHAQAVYERRVLEFLRARLAR